MNPLTSIILKSERRGSISVNNKTINKFLNLLSFIIVFGALASLMVYSSVYITNKLKEINQEFAFINIMMAGNFTILFFESVFQSLNNLYYSNDLKMFLRMPIKTSEIIHSKLIQMIISEYQMELIMLAIPMIVYGIINSFDFYYYLYIPVIMAILPIIPICITSIIIAIIMRVSNRIKNKTTVMYITIIVSMIVLDIITSVMGGNATLFSLFNKEILNVENGIAEEIANSFKLIIPTMKALINYNNIDGIFNLIIYVIESIFIYVIAVFTISSMYMKGIIGTLTYSKKIDIKEPIRLNIQDFKQRNYKQSYLIKELLIIKRSPIFFIQCIIFPIVFGILLLGLSTLIFFIMLLISKSEFKQISELFFNPLIAGTFLTIIQILYMLDFSSIIGISKEKRGAIISKYIPIKLSRQFNMKTLLGRILNAICGISIIVLYLSFTRNIVYTLLMGIIAYELNTFGEKAKLLIDLKNPQTDWKNEYQMMKKNTNAIYELFYTIIIMGILMGGAIVIRNIIIYYIVLLLVFSIINFYTNYYINKHDNKIFDKLN